MTHGGRPLKLISYLTLLSLLLNPAIVALAGNDFGGDWEPRPLVDTTIKPTAPTPTQTAFAKPPVPAQPELEAKLKPAEPFIHDVEEKLYIKPKAGTSLVSRLDTLQTVLFGEAKYQDANELLSKLAEIFQKEAAKAQVGLNQQLLNSKPAGSSNQSQAQAKPQNKPLAYSPAQTSQTTNIPHQQPQYVPQYAPSMATVPKAPRQQTAPKPKKKHFWQDDWESDFENDPFFNDSLNSISQNQQQGPSKLSSVGQGLAGLAMMAGGVAGTYYLNKKLGNNSVPNNQQYYNNPYYNNYGYPYSGNPYGYGYAAPYGYGTYAVPYGTGYPPPPPGTYGFPYGGVITSQPYRPYGSSTSTFGGISPLGVPTGF